MGVAPGLVEVLSLVAMVALTALVLYHHRDQNTMQDNIHLDSACAQCLLWVCQGQALLPADGIAQYARLMVSHKLNVLLHLPNQLYLGFA